MTVFWDVEERDVEVRFHGALTLITWSPNAEHEYLAIRDLIDQSGIWTAQPHVTHTYDRREARITFSVDVRSATGTERTVFARAFRDGLPSAEHGGTLCGPSTVQEGVMTIQSWMRDLPGGPNAVIAGTPPPPGRRTNNSAVVANSVMLYAADQVVADSELAGFFHAAHEIGHLIGLDDFYGDTRAARWCDTTDSGCAGNIMRETDQHRARYDRTTGEMQNYSARRPWVGRMELRDVAELALFAGRSSQSYLPQQSHHELIFIDRRRGSDDTHRIRRYSDHRTAPRSPAGGCSRW